MPLQASLSLHCQRWLRGLILAQMWAFIIILPSLTRTTTISGRYHSFWTIYSVPVRLSCAILLGLVLYLLGGILRQASTKWHARIVMLMALIFGSAVVWRLFVFLVTAEYGMPYETVRWYLLSAGWGTIGFFLIVILFAVRRFHITILQWKSWLEKATLFFLPLPVIFWGNMFLATTYPIQHPITVANVHTIDLPSHNDSLQDNVYIFVFDAWCSRLTFSDGEVRPSLKRLGEASEEMWHFSQAFSPGTETHRSMPRFLFQCDGTVKLRGPSIGFEANGVFQPTTSMESIFSTASRQGYTTYMVGWFHQYHVMLSDQVDFVTSSCFHKSIGTRPWHEAAEFMQNVAIDIGGNLLTRRLKASRDNRKLFFNQSHAERYTNAILDDDRNGQFAVFHLPIPHSPCCFGPQGVKTLSNDYSNSQDDAMTEQLLYMDRLIGHFLDTLRAKGKYEHSTIVFTSDHNWRKDKRPPYAGECGGTHVPLLIKFPGIGRRKVVCQSPVSTNRLEALISGAREVDYDFSRLEEAITEGQYLSKTVPSKSETRPTD